jgi:cytochrome P450
MAKNPQVQGKAQEEIDRVVGTGRLPDVNDRSDLPYIEAIYRELMRYEPPLGIGFPHSLVEDDVVNGYFIPKGLSILGLFGGLGTTYKVSFRIYCLFQRLGNDT